MTDEFFIPPVKQMGTEWIERARCQNDPDIDPNLFFPKRGEDTRPAKQYCAECRVRKECLQYALDEPLEKHGIWGGTSEKQRRRMRAELGRGHSVHHMGITIRDIHE